MAVKSIKKRKKASPNVVSMSGAWDKPQIKKRRKKKLSGINTSDMPKLILNSMVENGKLSTAGFAGQIVSNTAVSHNLVKGLNSNVANTGVYFASILGSALLPNKMKAIKNLLNGVAIVSGARIISNIGEKVGLASANHYDSADTFVSDAVEMSGYEMSGYEMSGVDSVDASVTDNYVNYPTQNQYDEFED